MSFECLAACGYCHEDKIVRLEWKDEKWKWKRWIPWLNGLITKFCQCEHFMYLNVGKHFTKEEVKDYFRKWYKKYIPHKKKKIKEHPKKFKVVYFH